VDRAWRKRPIVYAILRKPLPIPFTEDRQRPGPAIHRFEKESHRRLLVGTDLAISEANEGTDHSDREAGRADKTGAEPLQQAGHCSGWLNYSRRLDTATVLPELGW
jgi:hypothetical protein